MTTSQNGVIYFVSAKATDSCATIIPSRGNTVSFFLKAFELILRLES